eukprot:1156238-Pelagomonas_calceolata.AAC.2
MNVPVLRRDLGRIDVGRSSWDRAHKDSIRAAMVSGRGASTIKENPVRDSSGDIFRDFYALFQVHLILAGIHLNKEPYDPYLPLPRALTQMLRPTWGLQGVWGGGRCARGCGYKEKESSGVSGDC